MEHMDTSDFTAKGISDDELLMREVFQDDFELFYLHHYLTETFGRGDIKG